MDKKTEYIKLATERENLYRLLGQIYETEVNQVLLEQLAGLQAPDSDNADELTEGVNMLLNYLKNPGLDPLTRLAVDYARVFLGAGIREGGAAFLYESVYTSPERLIMQDARDQAVKTYRNKGLIKSEALDFPEDHIALELKFMSYLCEESRNALKSGDWAKAAKSLTEQENFLSSHLLNWVPRLCSDIEKYARTDFYRAVGKITIGFLKLDQSMLADMMAEVTELIVLC